MKKSKTWISWTLQEEQIVVNCIRENPTNLTDALRRAGKLIGRSYGATQNHYYMVIKRKIKMFAVKGKKEHAPNVKNIPTSKASDTFKVISFQDIKEYTLYKKVVIDVEGRRLIATELSVSKL